MERRADVLTYTTGPLDQDVEVIGEVSAEIWFRSSLRYADVFVRLCCVDSRGRSFNVCDGLISLTGADVVTCATVQLWPTAHRFKRGSRIRVQAPAVPSRVLPEVSAPANHAPQQSACWRPTKPSTTTARTRRRSSCRCERPR